MAKNYTVIGMKGLQSRIQAMKPDPRMMQKVGLAAVAEQKQLVPRRTGNLGRSIHLVRHGKDFAETEASANYAAHVEYGTDAHPIVARRAKALRFKVGGQTIFRTRVRHPGTKPQPYMEPGARRAVERLFGAKSLANIIIERWNKAA